MCKDERAALVFYRESRSGSDCYRRHPVRNVVSANQGIRSETESLTSNSLFGA
jgi:hypothetical protein